MIRTLTTLLHRLHSQHFLLAALAFLPLTRGIPLTTADAYANGAFSAFGTASLYPFELLLITGLALHFLKKNPFPSLPYPRLLFALLLFLSFAVFLAPYPPLAFIFLLKTLLYFAAILALVPHFHSAVLTLSITAALASLIGIAQLIAQSSLGLSLLGEPIFTTATLNIAKFASASGDTIRALATFPHANIFAAFLTTSLILTTLTLKKSPRTLLLTLLPLIGIIGSGSRAALFTVAAYALLLFFSRRAYRTRALTLLSVSCIALLSLSRLSAPTTHGAIPTRITQYSDALRTIAEHPFGVGIGRFTAYLGEHLPAYVYAPPHHALLAFALALGIPSALLMLTLLIRASTKNPLLILPLFLLSQFDHAFFTSPPLFFLLLYAILTTCTPSTRSSITS